MNYKAFFLLALFMRAAVLYGQMPLRFAHVSDTHIGSTHAEEDLIRTVHSINNDTSLSFVILSGDITDFGSDEELRRAKEILDSLNKPWYIVPGNHDSNWSESGTNSFRKIFGSETFRFTSHGYLFIGTVCGPNMRMSPGQVSRENIVWLDSTLANLADTTLPVIYVNHYPMDSGLNNWYEVVDLLKKRDIRLILCGHGHSNHKLKFEGIPAIMGRSNLRAKQAVGGYNVVTIKDGLVTYDERNPLSGEDRRWAEVQLYPFNHRSDTGHYPRPSYAINNSFKKVKQVWQYNDDSDIGSGADIDKNLVVATNSNGQIYALDKKNGRKKWVYQTGGKIYATPAIANGFVVAGSTDNSVYCLDVQTGQLAWRYETQKPIVANAVIVNGTVYLGSSDSHFRAFNLSDGSVKWDHEGIEGFVVTKPLFYNNTIYFGTWGTMFYALDAQTGALVWKWNNGSANRMFSPAACYPVATKGKIFIVAPDRYMTVLDAATGKVIWRKQDPQNRVRESMGLSADSTLVYAKTMDGAVIGVSTDEPDMQVKWTAHTQLNYDIAPTAITSYGNIVYVPSNSGVVTAVNRVSGKILWKHKVSNSLVTNISPVDSRKVVVTTMDGKVVCLKF